ncbi:MAG TPA: hypothetical protein VG106_01595 [Vicinamibacterales bacterium]|nr:hypothetical protein [Vicinamibacterales bacterium]
MATPSVPDNGDEETQPPAGILVSGNQRVAGELGTYCYQNLCADRIAWPPKTELPLLNATRMFLGFELDNREPFARWTASYGRANDDPIATLGQGGAAFDPDANGSAPEFREITFRRPPAGDWVVWVRVDLANGDLEYAWHVTVIPDTGS